MHGFNSSPLSFKAQLTLQFLRENYPKINVSCPQIETTPDTAIRQFDKIINSSAGRWGVVGSSLGGYFATYLSEKYQLPAVIINPAVKPFELLADYLGEQVNPYTQEVYQVTDDFIGQLKRIEQQQITQQHYLVMVQTGDEVLDYQQAVTKYQDCELIVQQGGDHSFINFEEMLPRIADFFKL